MKHLSVQGQLKFGILLILIAQWNVGCRTYKPDSAGLRVSMVCLVRLEYARAVFDSEKREGIPSDYSGRSLPHPVGECSLTRKRFKIVVDNNGQFMCIADPTPHMNGHFIAYGLGTNLAFVPESKFNAFLEAPMKYEKQLTNEWRYGPR